MGHGAAFAWTSAADIFREHAALTHFENDGARRLDLGRWAALSDAGYADLVDARWGGDRPFADGFFTTPNGRARLVAVTPERRDGAALTLNTGRYRDQWHTMTRTGLSPKLSQHRREPLVEIHPDDAVTFDIADRGLALVTTPEGSSVYRVAVPRRRGDTRLSLGDTDHRRRGNALRAGR